MVKSESKYLGQKRCQIEHQPSKNLISTDAPKDNQGLGEAFSPTDLVGAALGSCILTTIAIFAEKEGLSIVGARASVEKVMAAEPRRIFELRVHVELPKTLSQEHRQRFETIAKECPVHRSLSPEVGIPILFNYV